MTIEDTISCLRRAYPEISKKVTYDVDKKGNDFCELVLPNEKNPTMPVTITVNLNGCFVSAGRIHNLSGNKEMSVENAISAINDILTDQIVFVYKYKNKEDYFDRRACDFNFFVLTGREDDTRDEFNSLVSAIKAPVKSKLEKIFSKNIGIFEISSFNGKYDEMVERII